MKYYWLSWILAFIVPESVALLTGHPERTLSYMIWNLEHFRSGQPIWQWNAWHLLFMGFFLTLCVWLLGHFGWGIWR